MISRLLFAGALGALLGACGGQCDYACGACESPVQLEVLLTAGDEREPTIEGAPISCGVTTPGRYLCYGGDVGVTEHRFTVSAPGYVPQSLVVPVAPAGEGCCACPGTARRTVTLVPDGEPTVDAGVMTDAGVPADGASDGGPTTPTNCNPDAVRFPMGGELAVGTLCDDVFVCLASSEDEARVRAASSDFDCDSGDRGPCDGPACVLRTSTIDETELADICAVTRLSPTPELVCMVYL